MGLEYGSVAFGGSFKYETFSLNLRELQKEDQYLKNICIYFPCFRVKLLVTGYLVLVFNTTVCYVIVRIT